jgi:hypothetical protein
VHIVADATKSPANVAGTVVAPMNLREHGRVCSSNGHEGKMKGFVEDIHGRQHSQ